MKSKSFKKISILFFLIVCTMLVSSCSKSTKTYSNLLQNNGFENYSNDSLDKWENVIWDKSGNGATIGSDSTTKFSGKSSLYISNKTPNDTRIKQTVKVEGNSFYKLSCRVRTRNVGEKNKGANISVQDITDTSKDIKGTVSDWQLVDLYGKTESKQNEVNVTVGLGGYGSVNTGEAWFDDVSIEKVDSVPSGINPVMLYRDNAASNQTSETKEVKAKKEAAYQYPLLSYIFIYMLAAALIFILIKSKKINIAEKNAGVWIGLIFLVGFIVRIVYSVAFGGFPADIGCFKAWAMAAADRGLSGFYSKDMFCDYPPFYIYILYVVGKFSAITGISIDSVILIKFPPIIADIATTAIIYWFAKKHVRREFAILAAVLYLFNPALFLDSVFWGQVDSFFTLLVVIYLVLIVEDKLPWSAVFLALSVLMKPQGLFFAPVLLFAIIKKKDIKEFIKPVCYGLITFILVILPFAIGKSPDWIINLYLNTAGGYKYASVNGYNLFALLGANAVEDKKTFLFMSYLAWGFLFDLIVLAWAGFIQLKSKSKFSPLVAALLLNVGIFVMSSRMHERYMFPAMAISLLLTFSMKDIRMFITSVFVTMTISINIHDILFNALMFERFYTPNGDLILVVTSFINVLILAFIVTTTLETEIQGKMMFFDANADFSDQAEKEKNAVHVSGKRKR